MNKFWQKNRDTIVGAFGAVIVISASAWLDSIINNANKHAPDNVPELLQSYQKEVPACIDNGGSLSSCQKDFSDAHKVHKRKESNASAVSK